MDRAHLGITIAHVSREGQSGHGKGGEVRTKDPQSPDRCIAMLSVTVTSVAVDVVSVAVALAVYLCDLSSRAV